MTVHNSFLDVQIWPKIQRRNDDIVIATYAKFGHLRMQIIINELVKASLEQPPKCLPWVELAHPNFKERIKVINELKVRRILRTHLPADTIYNHSGKYVFIGRDPRDLVFNLFHFLKGVDQSWYNHFEQFDETFGRPTQGFRAFWEKWMKYDGVPLWPYFQHLQSWWEKRDEENLLLIHFLDFKANMDKELRRISEFLDLQVKPEHWPSLLEACDYSKISKACLEDLNMDSPFWNGGSTGTALSITWKKVLTDAHGVELRNKVTGIIGESGKDWLLRCDKAITTSCALKPPKKCN